MRPTEMIMGDKYVSFRSPFTGEPFEEPEWTTWDYALVRAVQLIEDFTDSNGLLVWEKESEKLKVEALHRTDRFEAAKEAITGRDKYKPARGEYFIPDLTLHHWLKEDDWPTYREWVESQLEE